MDDITNIRTERTGPVLFSPYTRGEGIKKAVSLSREDILYEVKESGLKEEAVQVSLQQQNGC